MAYRPLASLLFTLVLASSLPLGCGSEDGATPPANTAGQPSAGAAGQGGSGQAGSSAGSGGTGASGQGGAGMSGSSGQAGTDGGQSGSDGGTAGAGGEAGAGGSDAGAAGDGGTDAGGNAGASGDSGAGGDAGTAGSAGDGGAGGSDAGAGGNDAGSGGSDAGTGGSDAGSGGSDAGSGGSNAGAGGSDAGSGGSDAGMGGSDAGAGGSEMAGNGGAGGAIPSGTRVRIMASNLTSGNFQSYDPGHGIRILQGVKPDIVLMQEFNYKTNSAADIQALANLVLGDGAFYYRETGQIPNGVISRYPILASGSWDDPKSTNREFAWARIDIPGDRDLWAVSVHLLTKDPTTRNAEAQELVNRLGGAQIPPGDLVVLGGDFNTDVNTEPCFTTLVAQLVTAGPHPADQDGNENTNAGRTKPYDWVLADADLNALSTPLKLGSQTFPAGLVVDTRVYQPLSDIAPAEQGDSAAPSMQHMGVARDFLIPNP